MDENEAVHYRVENDDRATLLNALKEENSHLKHTITRITEHNDNLSREAGRLREENLQLNRYNNDLLVSERNLRAQIDELNANIDDREKTCFSADQVVALMIAAVTE